MKSVNYFKSQQGKQMQFLFQKSRAKTKGAFGNKQIIKDKEGNKLLIDKVTKDFGQINMKVIKRSKRTKENSNELGVTI